MIVTGLISIIAWIVGGIAFLLPTGSLLPTNFAELIGDLFDYVYGWDWLFPVSTLLLVFRSIILFEISILAWRSGVFLLRIIRGF